ncbi:sensor histidine kinase [Actinoplanes friuliensis]|uniref:histidine kinase n=1 Tax=Actinoplanes friuliensis DSM 7358 TaxID=1246995 RepID=U5W3Q8_9ACTN|nr:sensor histidine kinase [Actinoplanes friuliensis]AGZ42610.1 putative two-component system sensor kinase [Actinoplanes friuliensis DSM 7358]
MGRVRDWMLAAGTAALLVVTGWSGHHPPTGTGTDLTVTDLAGFVLLAAGGLALVARRRHPVAVLVVTGLCAVGYEIAGFTVLTIAYLVAVYAAVRAGHRTTTVVISVILLVVLPVAAMTAGRQDPGEAFAQARGVLELAWLIAAGAAGEALRQAERRADVAERTREQSALLRADEERLHIARELHDSLTHQISVIKVQAEAAVHVAHKRGEEVPEALLVIRDAGREAARELRATLETLRSDDRSPLHGLDQVPELVRRARSAGLDASLTVEGHPGEVPAAVDRTAYRIVQESLTNVTRHAAAATASVRIGYRPGTVDVRVDDNGVATAGTPPVPGVGLLGMRERVTALGGRLRAEPRAEGGFTVHAELPWDAS